MLRSLGSSLSPSFPALLAGVALALALGASCSDDGGDGSAGAGGGGGSGGSGGGSAGASAVRPPIPSARFESCSALAPVYAGGGCSSVCTSMRCQCDPFP